MKVLIFSFVFIVLVVFVNQEFVQKKNCMVCYVFDKKVVGLVYKDVVVKYVKDKDVYKMLVEKIQKGGFGVWGFVFMFFNIQVSLVEVEILVKWVLMVK